MTHFQNTTTVAIHPRDVACTVMDVWSCCCLCLPRGLKQARHSVPSVVQVHVKLCLVIQAHYRDHGQMMYARSLLVIHNIAHQGRGPMAELSQMEIPASYKEMFRLDDPIGGEHMNIMKAGIITAHRVVAVSHG